MKPFLLITTRAENEVALPEVASYQQLTGLTDADMVWRRAETTTLDDVDVHEYSGIILAGSPFTVSAPAQQKTETELLVEQKLSRLLDRVIAEDVPFLGICYGVGTIGKHQGAVVDYQHGEEVQVARVALTDAGKNDSLLRELPQVFDAFVGHKEAISSVPDHFTVLATSPTCPVQAFRVKQNVYATQFHPEMDSHAMIGRIHAYKNHGYFDAAHVDQLIDEVNAADVRASHLVLGRFIERYARSNDALEAQAV
ncbi:MAG: glutamine amidotransferase [Canibacter sp.]